MIERQTIIDQIEVTRDCHVQIRFGLLVVEDGKEISSKWHRTAIEPGGDVDAVIELNDGVMQKALGAAPLDRGRLKLLKAICAAAHTTAVVRQYRDQLALQEKEREQREKDAD